MLIFDIHVACGCFGVVALVVAIMIDVKERVIVVVVVIVAVVVVVIVIGGW